MNAFSLKKVFSYALFVGAFVLASYLAHAHAESIRMLLGGGGYFNMALFVLLTAAFVVFVIPLDIVFLIPVGVHIWGALSVAFLSIAGWVIGASIAFLLARVWGMPLVVRILGEDRVARLHEQVPERNLFFTVLFLRMLIPVDILSYALGLFSRIEWSHYVLATALGVAPFGFYFAYVGALPWWYQLIALSGALILVTILLLIYPKKGRR